MSVNPYADNFESGGYFYNAIRQDLAMVLGDTMSFGFQIQGLEGEDPDDIEFSVKQNIEDEDKIISISLDDFIERRSYDSATDIITYVLRIPPGMTQHVALGRYFYDLVARMNNDVITIMKGRLFIDYSVTTNLDPEY